jgi:protein gp37
MAIRGKTVAETTPIQWTDGSWSPWEGCDQISPGCTNCYAKAMNDWLRKGENWGPGAPRRVYSDEHWRKPLKWNRKAAVNREQWKVFPSVCDPFDKDAPEGQRERFWELIAQTPNITWLLLTKRVGNVPGMVPGAWLEVGGWPKNVWPGATFVNQEEVDRDMHKLLRLPAPVRFGSFEPLLGEIDLEQGGAIGVGCDDMPPYERRTWPELDWTIVGGESGRNARPLTLEWVRKIVKQCKAAGTPVLVKQLGESVRDSGMSSPGEHWPAATKREPVARHSSDDPPFVIRLHAKKGGDVAEWPEDLRVREFPK